MTKITKWLELFTKLASGILKCGRVVRDICRLLLDFAPMLALAFIKTVPPPK